MRTLLIAGLGVVMAVPGTADAQRIVQRGPGAGYPMPGHGVGGQGMRPGPVLRPGPMVQPGRPGGQYQPQRGRWGSNVNGRWWGGANAPGGWNAYRRPYRGWAVPNYWVSPRFFINDWQSYGLSQPYGGYNWVRYYDDAVLVDNRGTVYDTVGGLDWDGGDTGYDGGYYANDTQVYAGPADRGGYYDDRSYERRDNGLGGAAIGAVAGGVAGNLIAGRGNRLGGTLIGAGVGAVAGYAIDKNEDRGRRVQPPVAPDYGANYAPPPPAYAPPPPPRGYAPAVPGGGRWVSPDGGTTVTTTTSGGYAGGGYYHPGGTTTTVVVQSAPVVTTTTTEIYEDSVTYSRAPARKTVKRKWKPRPTCYCR